MGTTLAQLAQLVGGELRGDGSLPIAGAATLSEAGPGQIILIDRADKVTRLTDSPAAAAVVPRGTPATPLPVIVVADVHAAFAAVVTHFRPLRITPRRGISPQASVSPTARLAADVEVHPFAVIGDDVEIGAGSTIHAGAQIMAGCRLEADVTLLPRVVLYENTLVGARTVIHAGTVIGSHGFGYELVAGRHVPCGQLGNVEIGADVEIGANAAIDRGTYGSTRIGDGTKIDNLVMIAHNVRIGRHNILCAHVGIAGSTVTGDYVVVAGQVGVRDHLNVGDRATLGAQSGVAHDVPPGAHVLGTPAIPEREQRLTYAAVAKLPEMRKEFKALQRQVAALAAAAADPAVAGHRQDRTAGRAGTEPESHARVA